MARGIQDILAGAGGGSQFPPPGPGPGGGGGNNPPGLVPPPPGDPPWDPYDVPVDSVLGGAAQVGGSISPTNTISLNIGDVGGTMTGGSQSGITGRDAITQPGGNGMGDLFNNKNFLILGIGALFVILVLNKKRK